LSRRGEDAGDQRKGWHVRGEQGFRRNHSLYFRIDWRRLAATSAGLLRFDRRALLPL
jgi:hypothetical protein